MKYSQRYKFGYVEIAFIVVGIILCTLFGVVANRNSFVPEIVNAVFGCSLVALFSAIYGPVVGAVVGFVGANIMCYFSQSKEAFVISLGVCIYGFIIGRYAENYGIRKKNFSLKGAILYIVTQTMAAIVYYVIFYPLVSFVIEKENIYTYMNIGAKYAMYIVISSTVILVPVFFLINKLAKKKTR